jgi:hypothetical protein
VTLRLKKFRDLRSREYGILSTSQPYRPPRSVTGMSSMGFQLLEAQISDTLPNPHARSSDIEEPENQLVRNVKGICILSIFLSNLGTRLAAI